MAYVSERISRTELGCLFAAHVQVQVQVQVRYLWLDNNGVFGIYNISTTNVHLIEKLN